MFFTNHKFCENYIKTNRTFPPLLSLFHWSILGPWLFLVFQSFLFCSIMSTFLCRLIFCIFSAVIRVFQKQTKIALKPILRATQKCFQFLLTHAASSLNTLFYRRHYNVNLTLLILRKVLHKNKYKYLIQFGITCCSRIAKKIEILVFSPFSVLTDISL